MHPGSKGIHLILRQVRVVQQGGNQCQMGPLADPVSGHGVDLALEKLHCHGQRCHQRRWPTGIVQHQVPDLRTQSPQGLQLSIYLPSCSQLCPKLSDGLV
jgi:hypothetical protein